MFKWTLNQEISKLNVVTEAPDDMQATDYSAAEAELDSADTSKTNTTDTQTDTNTDQTQNKDVNKDTNQDETKQDDTNTDDDMDATDYSEDDPLSDDDSTDDTTDDNADDETPEEEPVPDQQGDKSKNTYLIRDFIDLYYTINNIIEKLNNVSKTDLIKSKVYLQVIENLTESSNILYDYIVHEFNAKSYIFNLYQFNLFLECVKVNIEIIKKSGELQSND